jgi:TPP-dependent pyruvate/acetoin dehydrogenase alpha subunit
MTISSKLLLKLYADMYRIRSVEEEIAARYSENKMRCPTHLSIGQEAVSAAFANIIQKKDYAVSTHRGHAHYLAKGGNLNELIAELYGKKTGCSRGKGGSMHLIDLKVNFMGTSAIVGNSIPTGVGLGLSSKLRNLNSISVIFLGEGAIEEGVFYESINFAVVKNLPVLFICENNLYSVYSPLKVRQPKNRKIYKMVEAIGIKSDICNGNDVAKSYKKLKNACNYIRNKSQPMFLEFSTYRWREHCGPNYDDDLNYRSQKEINLWKKNDPIKDTEKKIKKIFTKKEIFDLQEKILTEIKSAFLKAEKDKFPKPSEAYKGVYAL